MMRVIIIILFSFNLYAQVHRDFDRYIHSITYELKPGSNLEEVLTLRGYDLSQKDWIKITLFMNGMREADLASLSKKVKIYLPPKISFNEYLKNLNFRSIASNKSQCNPVSRAYLKQKFGQEMIQYISYYDLITSRKVKVKAGESVSSYIVNDQFEYRNFDYGVKIFKQANGIRSDQFTKSQMVYLPFCTSKDLTRKIASIESKIEVESKVDEKRKVKKWEKKISAIYGNVEVIRSTDKLQTSVFKTIGSITYSPGTLYSYSASIGVSKFFSLTHTQSDENVDPPGFYPEFGAGVSRSMGKWSLGIGYDLLNYFLVDTESTELSLSPTQVHRVSVKPFLPLGKSFGIFGGAGYLASFGSESISGFDYSLGANYRVNNNYSLSAIYYNSTLSSSVSEIEDTSSAMLVSLSYSF